MVCSLNLNSSLKKKHFLYFIIAFCAVFSIIPIITRNIIPTDMIENLYWGKEFQLGYSKHPPLFGWISYLFYKICFSIPESLYILTQINLLLGLFFIFKISKLLFSSQEKRYSSVLLFISSVCAVFGNEKFNASTILMSLFPAMFYFFIKMIMFRKKIDAVLLGIVSALAFIGKYFALLYIGMLGLFMILDKKNHDIFKTSLPYIAVIVFAFCISWHLQWIYESDFVTIKYALGKSTHAAKNHLSAFNFLIMQFLFFASSFFAFCCSYKGKMKILPQDLFEKSFTERFVVFITIVPNAIMFFASLIFGMRIGSFWGTNMMMTIGLYILVINNDCFSYSKLVKISTKIVFLFAFILFLKLGLMRIPFVQEYDPTYALNIRNISKTIEQDWKKHFKNEKMSVIKSDKSTFALNIYLEDSPSLYDCEHFDLFNLYAHYPYKKNVVVTMMCKNNGREMEEIKNFYKGYILFDNKIPVINDVVIYYAFVNVAKNN